MSFNYSAAHIILKSDTMIHALVTALVVLAPKFYGREDKAKYHICYHVSNHWMMFLCTINFSQ